MSNFTIDNLASQILESLKLAADNDTDTATAADWTAGWEACYDFSFTPELTSALKKAHYAFFYLESYTPAINHAAALLDEMIEEAEQAYEASR